MFERFKRNGGNDDRGAVATTDRPTTTDRPVTREPETGERFVRDGGTAGVTGREAARDVRARQREEFGGLNWGAAFFGWLVAIGMGVVLLRVLSAGGPPLWAY